MEAIIPALQTLLDLHHLFYLSLGVILGLIVGILPGLGGIAGLSLVLPFLYDMRPSLALAMMIGLTSVTATSDTFPSVLIGVPGTSGSQATVVDGFPMAKRGEATNGGVAVAGIVLGVLGIIVSIAAIVLTVQFANEVGAGDLFDCLQEAGNDVEAQQQCQEQFQQNIEEQFSVTVTPPP